MPCNKRKKERKHKVISLEIKGSKKYINYLSKHLAKEHPSTKKRMSFS